MKKWFWSILTLMMLFNSAFAAEIKLISDLWCPYACDPKSDKPGFMVEIAQAVFKDHGHVIKYEVKNWARAVKDVQSGISDGVVGASKADVPGFVIPQIPAGYLENYFWTLAENSWKYSGIDSLKTVKLGFINDYSYGEEVDKLIEKKHPSLVEISGNDVLKRMIQMTEAKRLAGFIENPMVLEYNLLQMKKDKRQFKVSSPNLARDPHLYIAFSPQKNTSKNYAKILDEGIKSLRKSGKLKSILQKYGLSDWAK